VEVIEIVRRWQAGAHIRSLARATGLSRNTVSKYIEAAKGCGLERDGRRRAKRNSWRWSN
jgi:transposase